MVGGQCISWKNKVSIFFISRDERQKKTTLEVIKKLYKNQVSYFKRKTLWKISKGNLQKKMYWENSQKSQENDFDATLFSKVVIGLPPATSKYHGRFPVAFENFSNAVKHLLLAASRSHLMPWKFQQFWCWFCTGFC